MNYTLSPQRHRSVRKFQPRALTDEVLRPLLSDATRTQTMGGMQLYSVVVTRAKDRLEQLSKLHFSQPAATSAPCLLTVCADCRRATRWAQQSGAQPGWDNPLFFLNALCDAQLFLQTFCLLSEARGLGYCYLGTVLYSAREIADLLRLPKLVVPVAALAVGWPDEQPPLTDRLPLEAVVHEETYHDAPDPLQAYRQREALPENRQFVSENALPSLAHVFAQVRYPRAQAEEISRTYLDLLRQQGFGMHDA